MKVKLKIMNLLLRILTLDRIAAITLAPFGIYFKYDRYLFNKRLVNHESIHWQQQMEMLIIFFYLWYFIEWIIRLFTNFGNAYRSISFEREAYANDTNKEYLKTRKPFSWLKYIFKSQ